jgi:hypothetical protein
MKIDIDQIESLSKLQDIGRKNFGEVFTPNELISEMLDVLPKEIWLNPNLRWLDPAAGNGNFFGQVFNRLMKGLEKVEPNEDIRAKHIIEKMLFFVEIQDKNCSNIKRIFNPNNKFKLNLCGDNFYNYTSLEYGFFDIVLGNPPYQDTMQNDGRKAKNHNLWSFFIEKGFDFLVPSGYLLFITPPAWMSPSSFVLKNIFLRHQVHYINLEKCNTYFQGIGSKFCYFLIQKKAPTSHTIFDYKFLGNSRINKEEDKVLYKLKSTIKFIPQLPSALAFSILEKTVFKVNEKLSVNYDSDLHRFTKKDLLSDVKNEIFRFKVIHTPSQFLWSIRPHKNYGKLKVFIPLTTYYEDIVIDTCGNTQGMGYIIVKDPLEAAYIKKILLSKLFILIANITRWSNFNVPDVMKSLPMIHMNFDELSDENIYNYFNLDFEEIKYIESLVKPYSTKIYKQAQLQMA